MIEFVQATKADVLDVYPQAPQNDSVLYGKAVFEQNLIPLDGVAVAVRDHGRCIGVYGIIEMWPGVARIWALFSEALVSKYPRVLSLHAKRDIGRASRWGFHRIEATADPEHDNASKFLEWLGFKREGLMRRYTPTQKDNYLYAKVCDVV